MVSDLQLSRKGSPNKQMNADAYHIAFTFTTR